MTTKEALKEISKCKSVDEIIKLAKKNGYTLKREKAEELFNKTRGNTILSENELMNVAGGSSCNPRLNEFVEFPTAESVTFVAKVGDIVERYICNLGGATITGKVIKIKAEYNSILKYYYDKYWIDHSIHSEKGEVCETTRDFIQKP